MKIPDVNVLLHAVDDRSEFHGESRSWLLGALSGGAPVGFAWLTLVGFIRISTRAPVYVQPLTPSQAMDVVDAWLTAPSTQILHPGATHTARLRSLLESAGSAGNLTNDAHLAALALEHKASIVTFDDDFGRFPGVRWERPR